MAKRILASNKILIEEPNQSIIEYCKTLILDNPDYLNKLKNNLWIGDTPKKIYLFERDGSNLILPFGTLLELYRNAKDYKFECDFAPFKGNNLQPTQESFELYDYQEIAVNKMIKCKNGILQAPCGSGKTQMGIGIVAGLGAKTLWLTHTRDLLLQSKARFERYFTGDYGTITGGKVDIGKDVTFATIQTMCKLDPESYKDSFDCVIVDECHHAVGTPTKVSQFYKVLSNINCRYKYGLSATLHRADGLIRCATALIGDVMYSVPEDVVKTMKAEINVIELDTPESDDYLGTDGTFQYDELINYLVDNVARNNQILAYLEECKEHYNIILTNRVIHAKALCSAFGKGVVITGQTPVRKRQEAFERIKAGEEHYIFSTYSLAKEGLDLPNLDRLHLVIPQKDYAIVKQSVGRIERLCEGKQDAIVYDYVDKNIGYCLGAFKKRKRIYK